ncbi:MAG: NAD(P)-dependent oxidoreductase [Clostridiales bacterium]|mgnify:FL=1|jgi:3-hydroxyisobutyrate dehydrogenase|nr:NAD(P)-dependent oxidoreductase [Clostridiales bacterium]
MRIGFIGVGVMGNGMVANLLKNGFDVDVFTRTKEKAARALEAGARWADDIRECVSEADAVITIVGFPRDVEEVYFAKNGVLECVRPGTPVIDMTTTSPRLAERIFREAKSRGIPALDAPVSGGDTGARNGTLSIMVGGERAVFEKCLPIFQAMGTNIRHQGPAGFGQHTKMANQIAIAGALAGACEAIAYGRAAGLDLNQMLATIGAGAAGSWQMQYNAPKIVAEDFSPGFFIKHFVKDMSLADAEARERDVPLPVLEKVLALMRGLDEKGYGEEGTQALIRSYL